MSSVLFEKKDRIGIITINRPESMNALNSQVLNDLFDAFKMAQNDDEVLVVILTGAGKAFVAGADISQMKDLTRVQAAEFAKLGLTVFSYIERLEKPVIAAINGYALGGGCELALSCDIRVASEKAKFGQPEVSLGITPGFGGTQRLPRAVGTANANELILTGEMINASQAEAMGLVSHVYAPEMLMEEAMKLAEKIANNAPIAVRQAKKAIQRFDCRNIDDDLDYEKSRFAQCFQTEDQKNAMTAFVEKTGHVEFKGK